MVRFVLTMLLAGFVKCSMYFCPPFVPRRRKPLILPARVWETLVTKNMYAICYIHDRSKQAVEKILGMDEEQRKLYDLVDMAIRS